MLSTPATLLHGSTAALVGRVAAVVISLVQAVALLRILGQDLYGTWSLLAFVLTATSVLDFGVPGAVERHVAQSASRRDGRRAGRGIAAAVMAVAVATVAVEAGALVLAATRPLVPEQALTASLLVPPAFAIGLLALVAGATLTGLGQFAAHTMWRTAGLATSCAATVGVAALGVVRLDALVAAYALGSMVSAIACWTAARRAWPGLAPARPDAEAFDMLFHVGGALQAASLAPLAADGMFRLLAASRFGAAAAGVYDIAARVSIVVRSLAGALTSVLVPHSVRLLENAQDRELARLHRRVLSALALFVVPATIAAFLAASAVAAIIATEAQADGIHVTIAFMLAAHLAASVALPALMIGRASGLVWPEAAAAAVGAVLGLLASATAPTLAVAAAWLWTCHALSLHAAWWWLARRLKLREVETGRLALIAASGLVALLVGSGLTYAVERVGGRITAAAAGVVVSQAVFIAVAVRFHAVPGELLAIIEARRARG